MALLLNRSAAASAFVVRGTPHATIRRIHNNHNNNSFIIDNNSLQRRHILVRRFTSVTGNVYKDNDDNTLIVTLFTKEGCTLCDKLKDVLQDLRDDTPHSLEQIDITDDTHAEWLAKYKYDIPVLHLNGQYWLKHRTTAEEARAGLLEAREGLFVPRTGEPNAEAMERN